jgi:predicted nucleotide-binding protein
MSIDEIQSTEEIPIIKKLHTWIEKGRNDLKRRPRIVKRWIGGVRRQLKKLYGPTSEVMDLFPLVKDKLSEEEASVIFEKKISQLEVFVQALEALPAQIMSKSPVGRVFIGHGRSLLWRELKDFLSERLGLVWDEFNREAVAGIATWERLSQMLSDASFAFLVMTAEDEHANSTLHARENVIHESGLFQGRLGSRKAIILLEEGCSEFSNIFGLSQLRFPKGNIGAVFEDIRRVLEREHILKT